MILQVLLRQHLGAMRTGGARGRLSTTFQTSLAPPLINILTIPIVIGSILLVVRVSHLSSVIEKKRVVGPLVRAAVRATTFFLHDLVNQPAMTIPDMTPASPISAVVGVHHIVSTRSVTSRYGPTNVLITSSGVQFFGNAAINRRISEGAVAPFHLEVGESRSFRPPGGINDVFFHPVDVW